MLHKTQQELTPTYIKQSEKKIFMWMGDLCIFHTTQLPLFPPIAGKLALHMVNSLIQNFTNQLTLLLKDIC